jgi:hypothetical protein
VANPVPLGLHLRNKFGEEIAFLEKRDLHLVGDTYELFIREEIGVALAVRSYIALDAIESASAETSLRGYRGSSWSAGQFL